jgi:aminodeoxyfutalosine synthase
VEKAKSAAGDRVLAGFSWADVARWSAGGSVDRSLTRLAQAGLDAIADLPLDTIDDAAAAVKSLKSAGFQQLRLTVSKAPADARPDLLLLASELQSAHGNIQSLNPLPLSLATFRPTTGYEDVKMVAIARLAAPNIPTIQVGWGRYGPKLAQVALTFGADDLDDVSPSDEAPDGRRRAPLEEARRNIEAAGFSPAERDGRFQIVAS